MPRASGLNKPLRPSAALAAIIGSEPIPSTEAVKRIWDYIRKQSLQNPSNRREILADAKLRAVVEADKIGILDLPRALGRHLAAV